MTEIASIKEIKKVCNFSYITEIIGGRKHLMKEILETFLSQVSEELRSMNEAVSKTDYATINRIAHSMQSSVAMMGIYKLKLILEEMKISENALTGIDKIKELNNQLNSICMQAFEEIENEKQNYI